MYKINFNNLYFIKEKFTQCNELNIINKKYTNNPKIVVIAGVHGNEFAPPLGVEKFLNNNEFIKGNLYFIPRVNKEGLKIKTRGSPCKKEYYDINRNFNADNNNYLEKQILDLIDDADFVLDFHEAYDFHKINKNSIGSTISPINNQTSINMSNYLVEKINKTITDNNKEFVTLLDKKYDIPNTLQDYCDKKNINYNLIEITGQHNKQKLELRINQTINILENFFHFYDIIKK